MGNFLANSKPVSFSRRTVLHGVSKQASILQVLNQFIEFFETWYQQGAFLGGNQLHDFGFSMTSNENMVDR